LATARRFKSTCWCAQWNKLRPRKKAF
jgi:hypothetical protein